MRPRNVNVRSFVALVEEHGWRALRDAGWSWRHIAPMDYSVPASYLRAATAALWLSGDDPDDEVARLFDDALMVGQVNA